jgi:hypothetical protein
MRYVRSQRFGHAIATTNEVDRQAASAPTHVPWPVRNENSTAGNPYGTSVGTTLMLLNGEPLISLVLTTV